LEDQIDTLKLFSGMRLFIQMI